MSDKVEEIWKTYPEFPFIEASNLGRIRKVDRIITRSNGVKYYAKGRVLKQHINGRGYLYVTFRVNGKIFHRLVHRIVAACFLPNPDNLPEINHIDNEPTNNRLDNLEWCNHKYNMAYKEKYGVPAIEATKALRKSLLAINLETSKVFWFESQHEASRQLGVRQGYINNVIKDKYNKTKNWWFTYADENAVEKTRKRFGDKIARKVEELIRRNQN